MDLYHIPNDDGQFKRHKDVMKLLTPENGYIDGATDYCLLVPYANTRHLSEKSRFWLAYLYALSYSGTTAIRMFEEFPSLQRLKPKNLKLYWDEHKSDLWFNPDKKYIKNNDQAIPAIRCLYQLSQGSLEKYMQTHLNQGLDHMYKEINKTWKFFGPHGAYLFFDALYGLCPNYYTDPSGIDWNHCGKTVPEGMAHMMYQDEVIESGEYPFEAYNRAVRKLVRDSKQPLVIVESTLCAYRKLFKQTRYHGYYADRMLEECFAAEAYLDCLGIDVWKLRKQSIPKALRGESNGWNGIRKALLSLYVTTGELDA